jgi:hypothetical protein
MRVILKFLLSLIAVLALVWLGLWWYAQGRLQAGFEGWAEQQATNGVKISYSSIQRGTSPLQALVTIQNMVMTLPPAANGDAATITLPSLALRIDAATPAVFHTDLPNKILLQIGANIDAAINTGSIGLSENLDPNAMFNKAVYPFRGGDLSASNVDILASQGSLLVLHIDSITGHSDINPNAGATDTAMASTTSFDGIALSPILTRIASIPFDGKIGHLATSLTLSGPVPDGLQGLIAQIRANAHDPVAQQKIIVPVIHKWAAQGGNGSASLALTVGPTAAHADGTVKFDANLQPQGTANITATHLDEFFTTITNAYPQLQADAAQVQAQLTPYLATTAQDGQTLTVHTSYGNGTVSINGQKAADLPAINWTNLENPQPTPAPTPAPTQ